MKLPNETLIDEMKSIVESFLEFSDHQSFHASVKPYSFFMERSSKRSKRVRFLVETLMAAILPVGREYVEFVWRVELKLIANMEFSDCVHSEARNTRSTFQSAKSCKSKTFDCDHDWRNLSCCYGESWSKKSCQFEIFEHFRTVRSPMKTTKNWYWFMHSSTGIKLWVEIFMDDFKVVVLEVVFEWRDESILLA